MLTPGCLDQLFGDTLAEKKHFERGGTEPMPYCCSSVCSKPLDLSSFSSFPNFKSSQFLLHQNQKRKKLDQFFFSLDKIDSQPPLPILPDIDHESLAGDQKTLTAITLG